MPQQSERGNVEQVKALLVYGDRTFQFLLPSANDHISKAINSGSFYEPELLEFLKSFLTDRDLVLDVGANIGNHTVFFAGVCGCEVEAFEPNDEASHYLGKNIELNALSSRVNVHKVALSDRQGSVSIDVSVPGNLGATSYKADEQGGVTATTADSFAFGKKVKLIKIDAEGMDALVVGGAKRLIRDDRPIIVAEAASSVALDHIAEALKSGDYLAVGCFNATDTYVFAPNKTASERALIARMEAGGLLGVQQGLKALKKAVSANKLSLDKVAHLQRQLAAAIFGGEAPLQDAGSIQERVEKLSGEGALVSKELVNLRDKLEHQQSGMFEWLKQFSAVAFSAGDTGARLAHLSTELSRVGDAVVAAGDKAAAAESLGVSVKETIDKRLQAYLVETEHLKSELAFLAGRVELALKSNAESEDQLAAVEKKVELGLASNSEVAATHSATFSRVFDALSEIERRHVDGSHEVEALKSLLGVLSSSVEVAFSELNSRLEKTSSSILDIAQEDAAQNTRIERLNASIESSMARLVEDLGQRLDDVRMNQSTLSADLGDLRAQLRQSAQDSLKLASQIKSEVDSGHRDVFQKLVSEQGRLSQRIEGIASGTQHLDRRLNALLNGRVFSMLRSLKRIGTAVRHPLRGFAAGPDKAAPGSDKNTPAVPEVPTRSIPAPMHVPARNAPPRPAKAAWTETVAPGDKIGASGVSRDRTVTEEEIAGFKSQVDTVRSKMPPCTSRKVSAEDLKFSHRPLPTNGLISVIMTTFNTVDYVEAAVNSIRAQTHENLELIVVDDGSTDGTREAVQAIAEGDPRVKCISFGVNRGTYWCKNYGITRAKGVAVTFMDSDDVSSSDRLEKQYALLGNPGCAVTTCLHERRDLQGNLITVAGRTKRVAYISQMMRRGVFDVLGYFDSVRTSADDEMLRRIKRFIGADAHKTVHEVLYHAVVRDASLTQDPVNMGLSALPGGLSGPRKAYSDAVDAWHASVEKRGRTPYVPFPVVRRPFPVHERLLVAPGHFGDEIVSVCIASFPPRQKQLRQAFNSLIDQVDLFFVYLNQYEEVPEFLKHPRVIVKIGGEDLRDNGKFYFTPAVPDGYCFTVDDDIIYPRDYVQGLIRKIELYGRKACVGLHGTVFAKPMTSYFGGRRVLHFRQSLDRDHVVDQLGTGTLAFHTSLWRPSCEGYAETGMVDAWVAVDARNLDIPLIAIERKKAWLTPIPMPDGVPPSLFEEFKSSDDKQTRLVSSSSSWGVGIGGDCRKYIEERIAANGEAFGSEASELQMIEAAAEGVGQRSPAAVVKRELFKLAVVGRTNKERWKKGGILKSTHLTADMLRPLGVEVALVDLEMDDPRSLGGFEADIVMVYPGDPERPDFKDVISLVDHHALLGRAVLVNLSLNGRESRKRYICEQMSAWRALYGKRVALMAFGDRVEDDPALAPIADTIVAIPKTLQYSDVDSLPFAERDGIFLGDYGKLCDETLLAWPADEAIEAIKAAVPEAHLFCVEQYRPKRKRDLGLEVLPFLGGEYTRVLSRSRLMVSLVKYATFEMVPMEVAAMGVPVLHPKMDNSLSDYLGLGAVEVSSVDHLARSAKALYSDPAVWKGVSVAGHMVARGLAWENMAAQMYLRLLNFRTSALS